MKINPISVNTPLNSAPSAAVQNCAQALGHANSSPAFRGKAEVEKSFYKKFEDKVLDKVFSFKFVPKDKVLTEKQSNRFNKLGEWTTYHNRAIIGAFAFATQPWIDLFNPNVDDETKKMSFVRTMAKIVVGTATGVAVRWGCIKGMEKLSKTGKELAEAKNKKLATLIMPTGNAEELLTKSVSLMSQHRKVIGTFIALGVMMLTDPPLTVFMTNLFNKQKKQLEQKKALESAKLEQQNNFVAKEVKNG